MLSIVPTVIVGALSRSPWEFPQHQCEKGSSQFRKNFPGALWLSARGARMRWGHPKDDGSGLQDSQLCRVQTSLLSRYCGLLSVPYPGLSTPTFALFGQWAGSPGSMMPTPWPVALSRGPALSMRPSGYALAAVAEDEAGSRAQCFHCILTVNRSVFHLFTPRSS
jgi:hypothetical protein